MFNTPAAMALTQVPTPVARIAKRLLPGYNGSELEARTNYVKRTKEKGFSGRLLQQHLAGIKDARGITKSNEAKTLIPNSPTAREQRQMTDEAVDRLKNGEELKVLDISVGENKFTGDLQRSVTYDLGKERLKVTVTRDGTELSDDGVNNESIGVVAEIIERPDSLFGYTTAIDENGVPAPNAKLETLAAKVLTDFETNSAQDQMQRAA